MVSRAIKSRYNFPISPFALRSWVVWWQKCIVAWVIYSDQLFRRAMHSLAFLPICAICDDLPAVRAPYRARAISTTTYREIWRSTCMSTLFNITLACLIYLFFISLIITAHRLLMVCAVFIFRVWSLQVFDLRPNIPVDSTYRTAFSACLLFLLFLHCNYSFLYSFYNKPLLFFLFTWPSSNHLRLPT